jgi:hypothetical protein
MATNNTEQPQPAQDTASHGLRDWIAARLTNLAPFVTLIFLVIVFSLMSSSF